MSLAASVLFSSPVAAITLGTIYGAIVCPIGISGQCCLASHLCPALAWHLAIPGLPEWAILSVAENDTSLPNFPNQPVDSPPKSYQLNLLLLSLAIKGTHFPSTSIHSFSHKTFFIKRVTFKVVLRGTPGPLGHTGQKSQWVSLRM